MNHVKAEAWGQENKMGLLCQVLLCSVQLYPVFSGSDALPGAGGSLTLIVETNQASLASLCLVIILLFLKDPLVWTGELVKWLSIVACVMLMLPTFCPTTVLQATLTSK